MQFFFSLFWFCKYSLGFQIFRKVSLPLPQAWIELSLPSFFLENLTESIITIYAPVNWSNFLRHISNVQVKEVIISFFILMEQGKLTVEVRDLHSHNIYSFTCEVQIYGLRLIKNVVHGILPSL